MKSTYFLKRYNFHDDKSVVGYVKLLEILLYCNIDKKAFKAISKSIFDIKTFKHFSIVQLHR